MGARTITTYYLTFIGLGCVSTFLGPALPYLAEKLNIGLALASNIVVAKSLGFMVGSFIFGRLIDRLRPHGMVQVVLVGAALATMSIAWAPTFALLLVVLFLAGVFVGSADVGVNILIVWVYRSRVGPYLTGLHCIWGVGALLAPLIVVYFLEATGSLTAPFLVLGAIVLVCALGYIRLPSPARVRAASEHRSPIPMAPMLTLVGLLFFAGAIEVSIAIWTFSYIRELHLASDQVAGWINSTFFAAITLSRFATAMILTRISNMAVLRIATGLILLPCIWIMLFPQSLSLLWVGVAIAGAGVATLFPGVLTLAPQYLPAEGRVTSWMFGGASLGFLGVPWVTGQLFTRIGPHVMWYFPAVATVMTVGGLVILHYLPRYTAAPAGA